MVEINCIGWLHFILQALVLYLYLKTAFSPMSVAKKRLFNFN